MSGLTTQQLSPQDKEFIKLFQEGEKKSTAFREAYPDHPASIAYKITTSGTPERQKASEMLADAAKTKLATKYIRRALATYQDKMEQFSALSLETATELVVSARSEKVRADLAIEGIRHKVGSPTVKVQSQEQKVVYLSFGKPPEEMEKEVIEGEVVSELDDLDGFGDN